MQVNAWFVKIESGIVEKPTFDQHVPAHQAYVQDLIAKGHRARTGYWAHRGGMMLFEELRWTRQKQLWFDPLVQNGCVDYQIYEWCVVVE